MKAKKIVAICACAVLLVAVILVMVYTFNEVPGTYDGSRTDVAALQADPSSYDTEGADGIAEVIVKENLDKTHAVNDVASIVFDFRGFDTLGESFILLTAIAGSFVILSRVKKSGKEGKEE